MTPDDPVTVTLVRSMIGESHASLLGEIKVLAEAQRGAAEQQRLAAEASSREHAASLRAIEILSTKMDAVVSRVDLVEREDHANDAIKVWRRRFWTAAGTAVALLIAAAGVVVGLVA